MLDDDILRIEVKLIRAFYGIKYKTIADELGIKARSLYNWLAGQFDFSSSRKRQLKLYIERVKEV